MGNEREGPFGAALRRYRRAAGLTQEEVAERAHLSVSTVSALERGVNHAPHAETARLLADALGLASRERAALDAARRHGTRAAGAPLSAPVAPGAGAALPLVGRDHELALLQRHLAGEGPPVLLVAGEPGVGKSRLLQASGADAAACGWRVLSGGCQRRGGQEPYAPLLDALARHIAIQTPRQARAALQGCAWLVRLLPELAGGPIDPLPTWTVDPEQERRLLFAAVGRFLANVAGPAGTLLVLDDLQWAGRDALDLVAAVVQSATPTPLRLIGAYRPTEVGPEHPLAAVLADLADRGRLTHHALGRLDAGAARHLLDRLLADTDATTATRERVLQRADGVPFFLVSCARGLRSGGVDATQSDQREPIPWDVAQSIRQRVVALPPAACEVLGAAAVLGRVVDRALLVAMVDQPVATVVEALEAACQARLLAEEGPTAYRFDHDMIHEVIEGDLGAARRAALHQRAAEAVERAGGAPVEAVAYHYAHSDALDKAATYLARAGERAQAQQAHAEAERSFHEALVRLDRLGRVQEGARVREALGLVLFTLDRNEEALAVLERGADAYRAGGDASGFGRVSALVGWALYRQGRAAEGLCRVEEALALLGSGDAPATVAALQVARATCLGELGRLSAALTVAEEGAKGAAACGDSAVEARAHSMRGSLYHMLGRCDEAERASEQARTLAEAIGDLRTLCYELMGWAMRLVLQGDVAQARRVHARLVEEAERYGSPRFGLRPLMLRAYIATYDGQWQEARADVAHGLRLARTIQPPAVAVSFYCLAGQLRLVEGRPQRAALWLRRALALLGEVPAPEMRTWAERLLAEVDLEAGRPEAALARLDLILCSADQHDTAFMLPGVARARLQQGRLAEAERVAQAAVGRARAEHNCLALVEALRVQAQVALAQDCLDVAQDCLAEGLDVARRSGYRPAEARLMELTYALHPREATRDGQPARPATV